jgi:hypothetical protein
VTRDEALALIETTNYPEDLRQQDHEFIAKKLGVTVEELESLIARPPVDYTAYPNSAAVWAKVARLEAPVGRLARRVGIRR